MSNVASTYEARLDQDARWAMSEGDRFFDEKSETHQTLRRIGRRLNELGIPYAIVGGMALSKHGFRRFTEDVHILVKKDDLKTIHEKLRGLGYTPPFEESKNLRDTQSGVRIEFLVTGTYPGDGKEKPIAFPAPEDVSEIDDEISYVNLKTLIELKLASGISGTDRLKDLGDVQELIKTLHLPRDLSSSLNPYVRSKYDELWQSTMGQQKRYIKLWRKKFLTTATESIEEMISLLESASKELAEMKAAGVILDPEGGVSEDYAILVTTDPEVAKRFDMHDETEYFEDL